MNMQYQFVTVDRSLRELPLEKKPTSRKKFADAKRAPCLSVISAWKIWFFNKAAERISNSAKCDVICCSLECCDVLTEWTV
jgi:hypothetical protein